MKYSTRKMNPSYQWTAFNFNSCQRASFNSNDFKYFKSTLKRFLASFKRHDSHHSTIGVGLHTWRRRCGHGLWSFHRRLLLNWRTGRFHHIRSMRGSRPRVVGLVLMRGSHGYSCGYVFNDANAFDGLGAVRLGFDCYQTDQCFCVIE